MLVGILPSCKLLAGDAERPLERLHNDKLELPRGHRCHCGGMDTHMGGRLRLGGLEKT